MAENASASKGKTILLISPASISCDNLERELKKAGFIVYRTYTGEEGIQLALAKKPDLIAVDIAGSMSLGEELAGEWATLSELKAQPFLSKIPTIVMDNQDPRKSTGFLLKDIDFLKKPVNSKLFIEKINHLTPLGEVPTLLIVDDDEFSREILREMIKRQGWKYLEAEDGEEAISQLKTQSPSVVLLDLMMPIKSGFDVVTEMHNSKAWHNIPIIIITAKMLTSEEQEQLVKHTQKILQKGYYSRKDLVSLIFECLDHGV